MGMTISINGSRTDETTGGDNDAGMQSEMICEINYEESRNDSTNDIVILVGDTEMVIESYEEVVDINANNGETVSIQHWITCNLLER